MTKHSSNHVWEQIVVFDSNTTDFEKSVVFDSNTTDFEKICGVCVKHHRYWPNSTDFQWMIWVESGVMCQSTTPIYARFDY